MTINHCAPVYVSIYYCPLNFLSHDKIRAGTYCRSQP